MGRRWFGALDLGTNTGWAIGGAGHLLSGTECFKPDRYSGGGMRYLRFERWLDELYKARPFKEAVFEEVRRHQGVDAAHVYGGLMATFQKWCEQHKVAYEGVPVGSIKKFATGKGNADKAKMIEAVRIWGYEPVDDNEADAIALWHCRAKSAGLTAEEQPLASKNVKVGR